MVLKLLFILLLSLLSVSAGKDNRVRSCYASDFMLKLGEGDPGVGNNYRRNSLKNISKKICIVRGYTAKVYILGYQNYGGVMIPNKKGKVEIFHRQISSGYTLYPNDTVFFTTNERAPNADINPIVKKVVLIFDHVRGQFLWQAYEKGLPLSGISFEKLEKGK